MEDSKNRNKSELIVFGYIRESETELSLFRIIPKDIYCVSLIHYKNMESARMTIMQVDALLQVITCFTLFDDYII